MDRSWEYINCSQTHECENWVSRAIPFWEYINRFSLQRGYGSTHGTYLAGLVRTFVAKRIEIYCLTADTFVFVTELNLLDDLLAHFWQADISIKVAGTCGAEQDR